MEKVSDTYKEHELHDKYDEHCSTCFSENLRTRPSCEICKDEGFITKTEWHDGEDSEFSYDVTIRCECQKD